MKYRIVILVLICKGKGKWETKQDVHFSRGAESLEEAHKIIEEFKIKHGAHFISAKIYELIETF